MAVQTIDGSFGENGFEAAHGAFLDTHESNSRDLLNLAEGRKQKAPRPIYDPNHPDNRWPIMVHHAVHGEKEVGRSLKGVSDMGTRKAIDKANVQEVQALLAVGWRPEPYPKAQVLVQDPQAEKAQMLRENQELRGQLSSAHDLMAKLAARLDFMEASTAAAANPALSRSNDDDD